MCPVPNRQPLKFSEKNPPKIPPNNTWQGGSVANVFLQDSQWRIRGLTRDTASPASRALAAQNVEMVSANLHDPESLATAFQGANLIFSVTDFWKPFFTPANHAKAHELNKSIGEYAYDLEVQQGKNIADAAAELVEGLDEVGFIVSTLSNARKCSKGKYKEVWHFNSKADVFPDYLEEKYPKLAAKTSYLQTGYFMTSWKLAPGNYVGKVSRPISKYQGLQIWMFNEVRRRQTGPTK
jgi:hypothetical protein